MDLIPKLIGVLVVGIALRWIVYRALNLTKLSYRASGGGPLVIGLILAVAMFLIPPTNHTLGPNSWFDGWHPIWSLGLVPDDGYVRALNMPILICQWALLATAAFIWRGRTPTPPANLVGPTPAIDPAGSTATSPTVDATTSAKAGEAPHPQLAKPRGAAVALDTPRVQGDSIVLVEAEELAGHFQPWAAYIAERLGLNSFDEIVCIEYNTTKEILRIFTKDRIDPYLASVDNPKKNGKFKRDIEEKGFTVLGEL